MLTNTTATGATAPSFAGPSSFDAFLRPYDVTAADLNADGRPDLVTANNGDSGVSGTSVLINTTAPGADATDVQRPHAVRRRHGCDVGGGRRPQRRRPARPRRPRTPTARTPACTVLLQHDDGGRRRAVLRRPDPVRGGRPRRLRGHSRPQPRRPARHRDGQRRQQRRRRASRSSSTRRRPAARAPSIRRAVPIDDRPLPARGDGDRRSTATASPTSSPPTASGAAGNSVLLNTTPAGAPAPSFAGPIVLPRRPAARRRDRGRRQQRRQARSRVRRRYNVDAGRRHPVLVNTTEPGEELPAFAGPTPFGTGQRPDLDHRRRPQRRRPARPRDRQQPPDGAGGNTVLLNTTPLPFAAGPTSLAFGDAAERDDQRAAHVTLDNSTDATLPVDVRLSGDVDDMLISRDGCEDGIPANGSCSVAIRFAPSADGRAERDADARPRRAAERRRRADRHRRRAAAGARGADAGGRPVPTGATGGAPAPRARPARQGQRAGPAATPASPAGSRSPRRGRGALASPAGSASSAPRATSWRLTRGGRTVRSGRVRGRVASLRLGRLAPGRYTLRIAGRRAATIRVRG